jgi:hypothetical protein
MHVTPVTLLDLKLARICELCPVCRHARKSQQGLAFGFVKGIEQDICPFCRAYERVHGRKAHQQKG